MSYESIKIVLMAAKLLIMLIGLVVVIVRNTKK